MKVNICGIPHEIVECEDPFTADATHFGEIDYQQCKIKINKNMAEEAKEETIIHEMVHGMLVHLGYSEQSQDETLVKKLSLRGSGILFLIETGQLKKELKN